MELGVYNIKKVHVIRLDDGEKIVEKLLSFAAENNIKGAVIYSLIGAVSELSFITAGSNARKPEPYTTSRDKPSEILGSGSIAIGDDGLSRVHIHMSCGSKDGDIKTGHLVEAKVKYFCEIIIGEFDETLKREYDTTLAFEKLVP